MKTFRDELAAKLPNTATAMKTGKSRKAAIKLMCLECVGGSRADVARCTDGGCPLFLYRPYVA